jgi:hypothetical protein
MISSGGVMLIEACGYIQIIDFLTAWWLVQFEIWDDHNNLPHVKLPPSSVSMGTTHDNVPEALQILSIVKDYVWHAK